MRVFLDKEHDGRRKWDKGIGAHLKLMGECGLTFVPSADEADAVLFIAGDSKRTRGEYSRSIDSLGALGKPVIVLETKDEAYCFFRKFDKVASIRAVFKNRVLRDPAENNLRLVPDVFGHSYMLRKVYSRGNFFRLAAMTLAQRLVLFGKGVVTMNWIDLRSLTKVVGHTEIKQENLGKIRCVLFDFNSSFLANNHVPSLREKSMNSFEDIMRGKSVDVFCVNVPKNGVIGYLRRKARRIVESKQGIKTVTGELSLEAYEESILRSRVVVSCFGHGEWAHADAYAMYVGAVLIKPRCDYVKTWPDLYRDGETYVACSPDLSDLEEKIDQVLRDYPSYAQMIARNRRMLLELTREDAVRAFCDAVRECVR